MGSGTMKLFLLTLFALFSIISTNWWEKPCPLGYFKCGFECKLENYRSMFRLCGEECLYWENSCNGSCPRLGYSACGNRCVRNENKSLYRVCNGKCQHHLRTCNGTCPDSTVKCGDTCKEQQEA